METKSKKLAKAVMLTVVGAAIIGGTISASAAKAKHIKCYGIAKKGKNSCGTVGTAKHACAGQAKKDNLPGEWVYKTAKKCMEKGGNIDKPKTY